jgi:Leucine-rich repeat (LRR) protein
MKNLRVLEVRGDKLKTLWLSESQVPLQLRELKIGARLSEFPKCIEKLKYLERIYLCLKGENNVETLPEEFCNLRSLKTLVLRGWSKMKSLPDAFGNLTNLQQIDLSGSSELERLPNSFRNLIRLKNLNLYACSNLTISSETLGNISTLENVNLCSTEKIEVFPPQIARQLFLEALYLEGTNLKELPSAIGDLIHLEILRLGGPLLETLPPSLGDLKNLKELKIRDCRVLKCLPDFIGLLTQLTEMTVENCPVCEVPYTKFEGERETLTESRVPRTSSNLDSSMVRLEYLKLYNINISEVSFDEGIFPKLQRLQIGKCNDLVKVGSLPNTVVQLELYVCYNLRTVKGLCGLTKLQMLSIQSCKEVEELPNIETLVSLEELKLSGCMKLKSILGLAKLTKLKFLYVNQCSGLEEISGVEQCTSLEKLGASGCPKLQWGEGVLEQLRQRLKEFDI